ncbi:hypothetical protein [Enterococcus phage vB_EfaS_Ef7.1]|nr:hypothetical protein [Enterococcus phage vB_EfaS_Ef7.1]
MKLKDLIETVDPMQDITLEISELTAPEGIFAKDIERLRPNAMEMDIVDVHTAWYEGEDGIETTLGVVVEGGILND